MTKINDLDAGLKAGTTHEIAAPGTAIADPVWFFSLAIFIRQAAG